MKKFAKLSLVAAVAVAGLSTANAASLEEIVKNTTVSGAMRIRVQDNSNGVASDDYTKQGYSLDVSQKISDDVTVSWGIYATNDVVSTDEANVGDVAASLGALNVTYTGIKDTTAIIGRQALGTPFTVAADLTGNDHAGNGILLVNTSTPVTLIAGHMDSTSFTNQLSSGATGAVVEEVTVAAVAGSVGPVALEAWYAQSQVGTLDVSIDHFFYKGAYKAEMDGVKFGLSASYVTSEVDAANAKTQSFFRIDASAAMGAFDGGIKYGKVGKNGYDNVAFDASAPAAAGGAEGLVVNIMGDADKAGYMAYVNYAVNSSVKVGAWYMTADSATAGNQDAKETVGYASWTMAKGTSLTGYFGTAQKLNGSAAAGTDDNAVTRIQLDYKF